MDDKRGGKAQGKAPKGAKADKAAPAKGDKGAPADKKGGGKGKVRP